MITGLTFFILNNLMIVLVGSIIYFLSKEVIRSSGGNLSKVSFLSLGAVIGLFMFYISFFVNYRIETTQPGSFNIVNTYIVYLILFSSMVDRRFFFPLLVFSILGIVLNKKIDIVFDTPEETLFFTIYILKILILSILLFLPKETNFLKRNSKGVMFWTIIIFIIIEFISAIPYFVIISFEPENYGVILKIVISYFSIIFFIFFIQMLIVLAIEKMYKNFSKLETYSVKDDISYYKMSLSQNTLKNIINEKKHNIGFLLLFDIKTPSRTKTLNILNKIKHDANEKYNDIFYFKATTNYYGIFIPADNLVDIDIIFKNNKKSSRTKEDFLFEFEKIILNVKNNFDTKINVSGSIYGIHSYDIKEIIEFAKFLFSPFITKRNTSPIVIYDFKRARENLKERIYISTLSISTKDTDISFLRAISKENIFYPEISFTKNGDEYINDITSFIKDDVLSEFDKEMILRNSSYQTLRKFNKKNSSLIIYYPTSHLMGNDFSIKDFTNKVERHIPINKLILGFFINEEPSLNFINNINLLRKKGVRITLVNPVETTQKIHDELNPDYLLQLSNYQKFFNYKKEELKINSEAPSLNINLV